MVGAPYAGVGGYQRGAALALNSEMEAGGVYTVPGDLSWLPGSEGTQVQVPLNSIFCQDYERSASSLHFLKTGVGLIGSPTARACAQQVDEVLKWVEAEISRIAATPTRISKLLES